MTGDMPCPVCGHPDGLLDLRDCDTLLYCLHCYCEGNLRLFLLAALAVERAESAAESAFVKKVLAA